MNYRTLAVGVALALGVTAQPVRADDHAATQPSATQPSASQPSATQPSDAADDHPAAAIEAIHRADLVAAAGGITANFDIDFGGSDFVAGRMAFTPSLSHIRMELDDGGTIIYREGEVTVEPADYRRAAGPDSRFHVVTWPYFMALPYKLRDPGSSLKPADIQPLEPNLLAPALKLTFGDGVGDAPDDWYLIFTGGEDQIHAAAYIVSYGADGEKLAEAEAKPSIIRYADPVHVDGVPFATRWSFHFWDPTDGMSPEPKGVGVLSDIELGPIDESQFEPAADARTIPAP